VRDMQVNQYRCPECDNYWYEFRRGEQTCPKCGRVLDLKKDSVMQYAMPYSVFTPDGTLLVLNEVAL
jgi:ssDNA-binding Zn-finger/Zn-ribbon topoisomerase 1